MHSLGCLHLFEPGGNPLIFVANAPEMKRKDPLCRGHRATRSGRTILRVCHLLQLMQILQARLQVGQARGEDHLSLVRLQQVEEGDTGKKLGVIASLRGGEIPEVGLQQLDAALGQLIEMPIGLAFLGDDLPSDGAELCKVFEGEIERLVVQGNHAAKRPVDILFLVAA